MIYIAYIQSSLKLDSINGFVWARLLWGIKGGTHDKVLPFNYMHMQFSMCLYCVYE